MSQGTITFWNRRILPECVDSGIDAWEFHTIGGFNSIEGVFPLKKGVYQLGMHDAKDRQNVVFAG